MLSLVDTDLNESDLLKFFIERSVKVKSQSLDEPPKFPMSIVSVKDGFVYFFDGIYAFATKNNIVRQIIVDDPRRFGLTLIDTREASKKHKPLIKKIESFLSILTPMLAKMSAKNKIEILMKPDYTLSDVREQVIKQSSL